MTFHNELFDKLGDIDENDTFSADYYAEWFIEGVLSDDDIAALTGEQMDEVAHNLLTRWGEKESEAWDDKALPLLNT